MSEMGSVPPPPPPPPVEPPYLPPPPAAPQYPQYDFARPFTFAFEDPRWMTKVAIGGLFYLAAFFLVGAFFILGYCARLTRNVIENQPRPLPEWDDLGEYLSEGLSLFGVCLLYSLPMIAIFGFFFVPAILMSASSGRNDLMEAMSGGMFTVVWCLMVPISLALSLWLPGALLFAVVERRFGAAFEFSRIWGFIRANLGNYLLAYVVYLVARTVAGFGFILCCIGVLFTGFLAMVVTTAAFAQTYRLARTR
ncbi:MAG: DUF4013 domain-containing protein [Acidobacteria bacterium]|nr:DUF4013 domain-containing protein [Acidobacteriota bacterium]